MHKHPLPKELLLSPSWSRRNSRSKSKCSPHCFTETRFRKRSRSRCNASEIQVSSNSVQLTALPSQQEGMAHGGHRAAPPSKSLVLISPGAWGFNCEKGLTANAQLCHPLTNPPFFLQGHSLYPSARDLGDQQKPHRAARLGTSSEILGPSCNIVACL